MNPLKLSGLFIYPLKSARGNPVSRLSFAPDGPSGDREWMVVDENGAQITARETPQLLAIRATQNPDGTLHLAFARGDKIHVPPPEMQRSASLFSSRLDVLDAGDAAAAWLTRNLNKPARLVRKFRETNRDYAANSYGGFGDVAPVLITNQATLVDLNKRLNWPLGMDRFRPNIVVEGAQTYAEDTWEIMRIGDLRLRVVEPCARCVLTTIDAQTGRRDLTGEPLRTLSQYRSAEDKAVHFGVYAEVINAAEISAGDDITVETRSTPITYPVHTVAADPVSDRRVLRLVRTELAAEEARHLWWQFDDDAPSDIMAGQFVSIRVPMPDGQHLSRSFTISASEKNGRLIRLSVRQQNQGGCSDYMVNAAELGDTILATGIHGTFCPGSTAAKSLFLSAGSGITPFLAATRNIPQSVDIHHIHADRHPDRAIARVEIDQAAETLTDYTLCYQWTEQDGRLTTEHLQKVPDLLSRRIWICGPQGFIDATTTLLRNLGVQSAQILQETFAAPDEGTATGTTFQVTLDDHDPVTVDAGIPLLSALRSAGFILPSSCEIGTCQTCVLRLLEGICQQLSAPEVPGTVLPCTSYARSDLCLATLPKN